MGIPEDEIVNKRDIRDIHTCIICQEVLLDPKECSDCQQPFCTKCIEESLRRRTQCPHCQRPTHMARFSNLNRLVKAELDKVVVRCPRGCGWTGPLERRPGHECGARRERQSTPAEITALRTEVAGLRLKVARLESSERDLRRMIQDLYSRTGGRASSSTAPASGDDILHLGLQRDRSRSQMRRHSPIDLVEGPARTPVTPIVVASRTPRRAGRASAAPSTPPGIARGAGTPGDSLNWQQDIPGGWEADNTPWQSGVVSPDVDYDEWPEPAAEEYWDDGYEWDGY